MFVFKELKIKTESFQYLKDRFSSESILAFSKRQMKLLNKESNTKKRQERDNQDLKKRLDLYQDLKESALRKKKMAEKEFVALSSQMRRINELETNEYGQPKDKSLELIILEKEVSFPLIIR